MPNEQCLRQILRILRVLEPFELPDHEIWQLIVEWLSEVISLLEADLNQESSSEEEQEIEQ